MVRTLLLIFCSLWCLSNGIAQPYENDWIDFSQPYLKIKVNEDGLHRIDYNTISIGVSKAGYNLNTIDPRNFQLFFRGEEQYIYIKGEDDGIFHSSDYIEFLGYMNDGTFDVDLYETDKQPQDKHSLFTDTSAYFLTWNSSIFNRRLTVTVNDTVAPPAQEPYFMHTATLYALRNSYDFGVAYYLGDPIQYLYSSEFDRGEGFIGGFFKKNSSAALRSRDVATPSIYGSGPATATAELRTVSKRNGLNPKDYNLKVYINGTNVYDNILTGPDAYKLNLSFPVSYLLSPTSTFLMEVDGQKHYFPSIKITYPRTFDFDNQSTFLFSTIDNSKQYLNIANFDDKGTDPILYDLTNHLRITGTGGGATHKFVVPLSSLPNDRELYLSSQDNNDIKIVTRVTPVTFTDYSQVINQGDFIIVTHSRLLPNGYIDDYKTLRSSTFTPVVILIDELYDQFSYGITKHPLSIRNFTKFVLNEWTVTPEYLFLIGKGVEYWLWRYSTAYSFRDTMCLIPTYGHPGSDNLLTAIDPAKPLVPQLRIGRLAAQTPEDVRIYLDKVKAFEASQDTSAASQTIDNKLWQKRAVNFAGGKNKSEQDLFVYYLSKYQAELVKDFFGAQVTLFTKSSPDPFEQAQSELLDSLINNTGVSLITFFGHAAANVIEFNLTPEDFYNKDKYHFVVSNGCFSGQIHSETQNMSERFVLAEEKGAVGFIASVYLAVQGSLDRYSTQLYKYLCYDHYGKSFGYINQKVLEWMQSNYTYIYDEFISQQSTYHGDPSLSVYPHGSPDYVLERDQVSFNPDIITAKEDSFDVNINVTNIGKALNGSIDVRIIRKFPDGSEQPAFIKTISAPYFQDPITMTLPTEGSRALGVNNIAIKVDASEEFTETSELNNEINMDFFITSDDLIPVLPYEFAIVSDMSTLTLKASTANAFADPKNYIIEIDTSELFNSPAKVYKNI